MNADFSITLGKTVDCIVISVVGVTLKLYNLLPHPTVKRTSRVNVESNHS